MLIENSKYLHDLLKKYSQKVKNRSAANDCEFSGMAKNEKLKQQMKEIQEKSKKNRLEGSKESQYI